MPQYIAYISSVQFHVSIFVYSGVTAIPIKKSMKEKEGKLGSEQDGSKHGVTS